ncbi:2-phosphosulfolactate phosphatase, partial [Patescibacteria group bacterium]
MKINTYYSADNVIQARGLIVVIDVFRAFSTACFLINNKAKDVIVIKDLDLAFKFKKDHSKFILVGERKGLPPKGFNYGNSPAEIKNVDFSGKTIILTTSLGTKGIINAKNSEKIITGSFVNADAIVEYIKKVKPKELSLVCTDESDRKNEDVMLAKYIQARLEGEKLNFKKIVKHLENHPCADGFIKNP